MAIRVLIVLDGVYRFAEPAAATDFTYTALVDALTGAGMQVTKAHRQNDGTADLQSFNFATSVDLLDFDVIWLIGFDGRNSVGSSTDALGEAQRAAIARYMDAGGGVFATGDHDGIGANMCGYLLRVRALRCWFGPGDAASPMPASFPRNFPPLGADRADTTRRNALGNYDFNSDGTLDNIVWFENQSDAVPQAIVPASSPAHPILRRNGSDVLVFPDHMHEGQTLGEVPDYDYTQSVPIDGQMFAEFPVVAAHRELPRVIATGQTQTYASRYADSNVSLDSTPSSAKTVNTLSVYDGRTVGVGRVVTGATFHHYVDINLTGDSDLTTAAQLARTGPDAAKGQGFNADASTFAQIKQVFVNITEWLARPRPALQIILERSTFGQDEATANPNFDGAVLVLVDGLKPTQFPGGGITTLTPSAAQLAAWAPSFSAPGVFEITPTAVASDDPGLNDRLQRFTFTYRVRIVGGAAAFGFTSDFVNHAVSATLNTSAAAAALTDTAVLQLTKSANPFMLDLADGGTVHWLSSDLRVFRLVAGESRFGHTLPVNATRAQALTYLRDVISAITPAQFTSLALTQQASALSPFSTTTSGSKVYNFAIARVRMNSTVAAASAVRVFFRCFTSQTTAALTYNESPPGVPTAGYKKTAGASPIALPGTNGANTEWLSFPFFSALRSATPSAQTDPDNVKSIAASEHDKFFGALIDNNLADTYLPSSPLSGGAAVSLPTLLMGEHQCLVAQIENVGTPIPNGANPATSDKLAQRNLALSEVANPGLTASRVALHTFEIDAAPNTAETFATDELLLQSSADVPDGTAIRLFIPTWQATEVVALADRYYPRHEIQVIDAHTIALPAGGARYVPLPRSTQRQNGVLAVELPLGIRKGERFDVSVRQITTHRRGTRLAPKIEKISLKEAQALIRRLTAAGKRNEKQDGVFDLGDNKVLITAAKAFDGRGGEALLVEHPDPQKVAEERRTASWRQTVGAFQLGVPVSTKAEMLPYQLRLLSLFQWRAATLRPAHRWFKTLNHYVDLLADKVRALGGDPHAVAPSPDGTVDLPPTKDDGTGPTGDPGADGGVEGQGDDPFFEPGAEDWLSDTNGLAPPATAKPRLYSGKISGLLFDHFGDFEGFTLEASDGEHSRFFSRERAIEALARTAWAERQVVTVITVSAASRRIRRLLLRGHARP
jgi:hypothetical protein